MEMDYPFKYTYINSLVLKQMPVVHQNEDVHLVMFYPWLKYTEPLGEVRFTKVKTFSF